MPTNRATPFRTSASGLVHGASLATTTQSDPIVPLAARHLCVHPTSAKSSSTHASKSQRMRQFWGQPAHDGEHGCASHVALRQTTSNPLPTIPFASHLATHPSTGPSTTPNGRVTPDTRRPFLQKPLPFFLRRHRSHSSCSHISVDRLCP